VITPKHVEEISSFFPLKVLRAAGDDPRCEVALVRIAKSLRDLFRFFEPSFFNGKLFVSKHFNDQFIYEKNDGVMLLDKNPLLERIEGNLFIQVFNDGQVYLWEDQDEESLSYRDDVLTYFFEDDREYFLVARQKIEFTQYPYGSMFAPQFYFLAEAFEEYKRKKIRNSSCPLFSEAWHRPVKDAAKNTYYDNHVLFRGASDSPEKPIQESLSNFLKDSPNFRGIDLEVNPEFNVDPKKPKPVDFRVTWLEANRTALVELKWVGDSISADGNLKPRRDARVNEGLLQLKGYWDSARQDYPNKLMKAFLVVIDGRRRGLTKHSVEVTFADGFHYQNQEFEIQADRKYFEVIVGFEKPVRMFAEPICMIK
jgi:hypothetical protein